MPVNPVAQSKVFKGLKSKLAKTEGNCWLVRESRVKGMVTVALKTDLYKIYQDKHGKQHPTIDHGANNAHQAAPEIFHSRYAIISQVDGNFTWSHVEGASPGDVKIPDDMVDFERVMNSEGLVDQFFEMVKTQYGEFGVNNASMVAPVRPAEASTMYSGYIVADDYSESDTDSPNLSDDEQSVSLGRK